MISSAEGGGFDLLWYETYWTICPGRRAIMRGTGDVAPGNKNSQHALRSFVQELLETSAAVPLPDRAAALGEAPFPRFDDLSAYERDVLAAERA